MGGIEFLLEVRDVNHINLFKGGKRKLNVWFLASVMPALWDGESGIL